MALVRTPAALKVPARIAALFWATVGVAYLTISRSDQAAGPIRVGVMPALADEDA